MTEKMITPLRQRMIDDMTIRNLSPSTKKIYLYAVAKFSRFHGRSPDKLTMEDVRDYRLHLISRGYQATSINPIMGALRFFYATTLGQKGAIEHMPYARTADRLPAVLTGDEVTRFLKAVRDYWRHTRPPHWLFPGPDPSRPITTRTVERACRAAVTLAGLDESVTVHTLRHSFATHLLEQGVDIRVIQDLLGHRNIASTARYTRVAIDTIRKIHSPLERLTLGTAPSA